MSRKESQESHKKRARPTILLSDKSVLQEDVMRVPHKRKQDLSSNGVCLQGCPFRSGFRCPTQVFVNCLVAMTLTVWGPLKYSGWSNDITPMLSSSLKYDAVFSKSPQSFHKSPKQEIQLQFKYRCMYCMYIHIYISWLPSCFHAADLVHCSGAYVQHQKLRLSIHCHPNFPVYLSAGKTM